MSKYFVRYAYEVSHKVPRGDGMGWNYEDVSYEYSCIIEMQEEDVDVNSIRQRIFDEDLKTHTSNPPDVNKIDILVLNKL